MEYSPQSEREIRNQMVLPPGEYDFEIVSGKDTVSKTSGNEMIALSVRVFPHDASSPRLINDYLVPGSSLGELKINRFCHAVGLEDVYFAGDLTGVACEGAAGRLKLTIQSSERYGDQNSVRDYIVPMEGDESSQAAPAEAIGVPAQQTKRAMKKTHEANEALQEDGFEKQLATNNDDIPF